MLSRRALLVLSAVILVGLVSIPSRAHVPIGSKENDSLETSFEIPNPTKSWVVYSEIHEGGEGRYYRFDLEEGTRLRFTLFIPNQFVGTGFLPAIALMGPGIANDSILPDYLEAPKDVGISMIEGEYPEAPRYEGFTPSTYTLLIDVDTTAPATGTYHIVVHEPTHSGRFGMAIGYVESFTLEEWVLVPFSVMLIYQWEGQPLALVLAPMILTVGLGLLILGRRRPHMMSRRRIPTALAALAALFFIGSSTSLIFQMVYALIQTGFTAEATITIVFAAIPSVIATSLMRVVKDSNWEEDRMSMVKVGVTAGLALIFWAGLIVGPILAATAAIIAGIRSRRTKADSEM